MKVQPPIDRSDGVMSWFFNSTASTVRKQLTIVAIVTCCYASRSCTLSDLLWAWCDLTIITCGWHDKERVFLHRSQYWLSGRSSKFCCGLLGCRTSLVGLNIQSTYKLYSNYALRTKERLGSNGFFRQTAVYLRFYRLRRPSNFCTRHAGKWLLIISRQNWLELLLFSLWHLDSLLCLTSSRVWTRRRLKVLAAFAEG